MLYPLLCKISYLSCGVIREVYTSKVLNLWRKIYEKNIISSNFVIGGLHNR